MAVYQPSYIDKTGKRVKSKTWWYNFTYAGRRIQESTKSARKTIALEAEKQRRRQLEKSFNDIEDKRAERLRSVTDLATAFLADYKLRNVRSSDFADFALRHVKKHLGKSMSVDITDTIVQQYQTTRLKEEASPKSINDEVGLLLRLLGEQGDFLRAKLKRNRTLKLIVRTQVARAYTLQEKDKLLAAAKARRSPTIYPALMLALHTGLRDSEVRGLQWGRVDLVRAVVTVGDSKTEAGQGRTVPLNSDVLAALVDHSKWFLKKFGRTDPAFYLFPFGKAWPADPTRPATSFNTAWAGVRKDAGVVGRWHDNRHTFITNLAESGEAGDETIRDIAGHVSKQMLKHYSHIGQEAKKRTVDSLVRKPAAAKIAAEPIVEQNGAAKDSAKVELIQ